MVSCMYIKSLIWIIGFLSLSGSVPWVHPLLEALDEINDAEIYRAVVKSMNEWQRSQELKKISNRTKREESRVCYGDRLGCFESTGPFGYLDALPARPDDVGTRFLLYPRRQGGRRERSPAPADVPFDRLDEAFVWAAAGFNATLPTKVLIHGFGSDCGYIWIYEIRSALMAVEEVNIICVDWSNGAQLPNYVKATANTRLVGKQLSILLRGLVEKNGLSLENTHLIGFSLGAHIAGFAGADLGNLSRITGLDPAGPLFESQDNVARLDDTDADFVDVIHSNGENLILGGLGTSQPMGHVDFYPNGGRMQKGCSHLFVGAVSDIIWSSTVEGRSLCNHRRAYKFFIDSVSPRCHFPAFPCESYEDFLNGKCFPCTDKRRCGNMGYYADKSMGRGPLYLITRDEEPFCAHQYLVKIESSPSEVPIKSYGKIQITLIGDSFLNETFMMTRKEDEEMKLGDSISRILVPHPILAQPTKVEILYTAYSGWLSSGLTQWRIDKVSLMDSFGKMSSVCKKNLILESGEAKILLLNPGDCVLSSNTKSSPEAEDRMQEAESKDTKNLTVHTLQAALENEKFKNEISSTFENEKDNKLPDIAAESSRSFNTRIIKDESSKLSESDGLIREIVEPILKPHSNKIARSHKLTNDRHEISEPILGPSTSKNSLTTTRSEENFKPVQWESKNVNPLEAIANTVQFLPQRIARMFEQAEKYAKETILPLVSNYTPKFISDFIAPKPKAPTYIPLNYSEPVPEQSTTQTVEQRSPKNKKLSREEATTEAYTHIQKIKKKTENKGHTLPPSVLQRVTEEILTLKDGEKTRKTREENSSSATKGKKAIYIDLPVFDDASKDAKKYIPLS